MYTKPHTCIVIEGFSALEMHLSLLLLLFPLPPVPSRRGECQREGQQQWFRVRLGHYSGLSNPSAHCRERHGPREWWRGFQGPANSQNTYVSVTRSLCLCRIRTSVSHAVFVFAEYVHQCHAQSLSLQNMYVSVTRSLCLCWCLVHLLLISVC